MVEVSTFYEPVVSEQKKNFVEARLHADSDDDDLRARIAELVESVAKSGSQPIYVVVDPSTEVEISRWPGAPITESEGFSEFLKDMHGVLQE